MNFMKRDIIRQKETLDVVQMSDGTTYVGRNPHYIRHPHYIRAVKVQKGVPYVKLEEEV